MTKKFKGGFTLIELLVVIAIIGILSAIVMFSLSTSRDRGGDAAVKQNLNNMRSVAELYYTNNGDYGAWNGGAAFTCPTPTSPGTGLFSDTTILRAIAAALSAGGGSGTHCVVTGDAYAIAVGMKSAGKTWCIDSLNVSKQFSGTPTAAITNNHCS